MTGNNIRNMYDCLPMYGQLQFVGNQIIYTIAVFDAPDFHFWNSKFCSAP